MEHVSWSKVNLCVFYLFHLQQLTIVWLFSFPYTCLVENIEIQSVCERGRKSSKSSEKEGRDGCSGRISNRRGCARWMAKRNWITSCERIIDSMESTCQIRECWTSLKLFTRFTNALWRHSSSISFSHRTGNILLPGRNMCRPRNTTPLFIDKCAILPKGIRVLKIILLGHDEIKPMLLK